MALNESLSYGNGKEESWRVLAKSTGSAPLSAWSTLAVSVLHQALHDAAEGDYDALLWLVGTGRAWLTAAGQSLEVVDAWGMKL
jgi:hypothetical protein